MKCSFCGADIPEGTGKIVVLPDGSYLTFCSRKCEKNYLALKRSPQKVKWTSKYHEEKEIRLYGKAKKKEKEKMKEEEAKPKKKKLSKKERRELRKQRKLEKKKKKKEMKEKKETSEEQVEQEVEGGETQ